MPDNKTTITRSQQLVSVMLKLKAAMVDAAPNHPGERNINGQDGQCELLDHYITLLRGLSSNDSRARGTILNISALPSYFYDETSWNKTPKISALITKMVSLARDIVKVEYL